MELKDIKVAIFDFDDTLAIHKDPNFKKKRNENENNFFNYYVQAYLSPDNFYEEIEPCLTSSTLHKLITLLKNNSVKLYCLTGVKFSFHLKAKEHFVHKYYDKDIEIISTQSQERKTDATRIIQKINKCELNEILFVDDLEENIKRLNSLGVNAFLPEETQFLIK